jgi:peptidoglycan/LPS O-acetylase OafA/YrhL
MSETPAKARLAGLDGLRGLACMCVVTVHVAGLLAPTTATSLHLAVLGQGVTYFFVMSGFLIFLPFCRAVLGDGPLPSVRDYASHRVRRIYPAYLVIFVVADFVLAATYQTNAVDVGRARSDVGTGRITDPLRILEHVTLVQNLFPSQIQTGINTSWSLTTELGFYLLVPPMAFAMVALARRRRPGSQPGIVHAMIPVAVLLAIGLGTKAWVAHLGHGRPDLSFEQLQFGRNGIAVLARTTFGHADGFAWGMAVAVLYVAMQNGRLPRWTGTRLWVCALAVAVPAGVLMLYCVSTHSVFDGASFALASAAIMLAMVEPPARGRPSTVARWCDTEPLKHLGTISLSVYLWHYPVLVVLIRAGWFGPDSAIGLLESFLLVSAVTVALSEITYRFVEYPALRRGRRTSRHDGAGHGTLIRGDQG